MPEFVIKPEDFDKLFASFLAGSQKKIDDDWAKQEYTKHFMSPLLEAHHGTRFVKIMRRDRNLDGSFRGAGGSAWGFIDKTGGKVGKFASKMGDVLKAASWKTPAPHARGNIFDEYNGLRYVSHMGPAYLR